MTDKTKGSRKADGRRPEETMTREEAEALARRIADVLEDLRGGYVTDFLLLQRWYAYRATPDDAENVYVQTERDFCVNVEGVEEAVYANMSRRLGGLRGGNADAG